MHPSSSGQDHQLSPGVRQFESAWVCQICPGFGWGFYDPFWGDPWGRNIDINTIDKYEAHAEIVMGRGTPPPRDTRAFDAHEVIQNLGPTIVMPGTRR